MVADMINESHNNLLPEDFEEAEQFNDESIPDDAQPLCFNCLKPCHPLQYYCDNCDSNEVINPLASYMPFVRIRFEVGMVAKMGRIILYDKEASMIFRLLCLLVIILWFVLAACSV